MLFYIISMIDVIIVLKNFSLILFITLINNLLRVNLAFQFFFIQFIFFSFCIL